ncbi:hypothetical protein OS493_003483 [Desmophyllum pertusum]|uniref:Uncharacterized protein n=1 Tax=Desmophyllum pertusum TaxID=174260 RepID=A0A9X0A5M1_9CNID|nr:hypothetical protein OS493_003483 [Desmophyllum pertusum]
MTGCRESCNSDYPSEQCMRQERQPSRIVEEMCNYNLVVRELCEIMQVEAVRAAATDKDEMVLLKVAQKAPIGEKLEDQGFITASFRTERKNECSAMLCSNKYQSYSRLQIMMRKRTSMEGHKRGKLTMLAKKWVVEGNLNKRNGYRWRPYRKNTGKGRVKKRQLTNCRTKAAKKGSAETNTEANREVKRNEKLCG